MIFFRGQRALGRLTCSRLMSETRVRQRENKTIKVGGGWGQRVFILGSCARSLFSCPVYVRRLVHMSPLFLWYSSWILAFAYHNKKGMDN